MNDATGGKPDGPSLDDFARLKAHMEAHAIAVEGIVIVFNGPPPVDFFSLLSAQVATVYTLTKSGAVMLDGEFVPGLTWTKNPDGRYTILHGGAS